MIHWLCGPIEASVRAKRFEQPLLVFRAANFAGASTREDEGRCETTGSRKVPGSLDGDTRVEVPGRAARVADACIFFGGDFHTHDTAYCR